MRLYHYKLLPFLPQQMIISQWRECIAIKRQWEKGTLKHRLVSYVMNYDKRYFYTYVSFIEKEMVNRNIKHQKKYCQEFEKFCNINDYTHFGLYPEHNDRYLKQCYYNLQEKFDCGIISEEEWKKIEDFIGREVK